MGGWGQRLLALGLLLGVIGGGPLLVLALFVPDAPAVIPVLLSLTVLPLGAVCVVAGLIALALGWMRRR